MSAETVLFTSLPCLFCGERSEVTLDAAAYSRWRGGHYVQTAFPEMSAEEREVLITGTHAACWVKIFGPEEEEIDAADVQPMPNEKWSRITGI